MYWQEGNKVAVPSYHLSSEMIHISLDRAEVAHLQVVDFRPEPKVAIISPFYIKSRDFAGRGIAERQKERTVRIKVTWSPINAIASTRDFFFFYPEIITRLSRDDFSRTLATNNFCLTIFNPEHE